MEHTSPVPRLLLPVSARDHVQGPVDAPLTLVEYGDYECPYCRLVYADIRQLQDALGDSLRYVYRHLPIADAHPHASTPAQMPVSTIPSCGNAKKKTRICSRSGVPRIREM